MIEDFRDLLRALAEQRVRFLVVGAHALAAHGVPRATGDLDIWVEADAENAAAVWSALAAFGAPLASLGIAERDFETPDQIVQLGLPPFRVDVMTSISGITFSDAWEQRLSGSLFDVSVDFIGRDSLITNKKASGRPKDLEDVRSLGG